jgi:hypothetical protein
LHDWDGDGKPDLLWGTQQGNVYLHRARGGDNPFDFDEGVLLKLNHGEPLRVGPPVVDSPEKATDFTILQGSRIRLVVTDFDCDRDLLVCSDFFTFFVEQSFLAHGYRPATGWLSHSEARLRALPRRGRDDRCRPIAATDAAGRWRNLPIESENAGL